MPFPSSSLLAIACHCRGQSLTPKYRKASWSHMRMTSGAGGNAAYDALNEEAELLLA